MRNEVKSMATVRLEMEFLSQNMANPFAGDLAFIVRAVPVDEPARNVLDGEFGVEGRGKHIPDDLQNLRLHIHAPVRDQFLVVLSSQIPEVVSGLWIINDREEWHENLVEPRLDRTVHQVFAGLAFAEISKPEK